MRPYKDLDNRIDGAVLAVFDIDDVRRTEERIARTRTHLMNMLEDAGEPILVVSQDRRVRHANRAFQRKFGRAPERLEGGSLEVGGDQPWNVPQIQGLLDQVFASGEVVKDVTFDGPRGDGRPRFSLDARPIDLDDGAAGVALCIRDSIDGAETAS